MGGQNRPREVPKEDKKTTSRKKNEKRRKEEHQKRQKYFQKAVTVFDLATRVLLGERSSPFGSIWRPNSAPKIPQEYPEEVQESSKQLSRPSSYRKAWSFKHR